MSLLRLLLHVIAHFQIFYILHLRSETEGEGHESYRSQCTFLMTHLDQGSGMKVLTFILCIAKLNIIQIQG